MSDVKQECIRLVNSGMKPQEIYDTYYSTVREATFSTFDRMLRKWKAETKPVQKDKRAFDLIETLKKGIQMSELSDRLNVSPKACESLIDDIRGQGYNVQQIGEEIKISNIIVPADNRIANQWNGEKVIRFGLMGDTQINSKYTQITHLHDFYDKCKAEGIDTVYHTGDIDDGEKMRPGHEYELYNQGADDHIAEIVKVYPNNGVKTYFITGNHDAAYVKLCGLDIGYKIAEKRPDMTYLGYMSSTINLTDNCTMELRHPIDGSCFDDKTEVFTKDGWKPFSELSKKDYVATMTKSEHEFQWQQPTEITMQSYDGDMYYIKSRTVDMAVTPNHGLWVRRNPTYRNIKQNYTMPSKSHPSVDYRWKRMTAKEMTDDLTYRQKYQMSNCCEKWIGNAHPLRYDIPFVESKNKGMDERMTHIGSVDYLDFCKLIAWFVTEGYVGDKVVSICQSQTYNPLYHKMICDLLTKMQIKYSITGRDNKDIDIHSKELSQHIKKLCGEGTANKRIPTFVKELPANELKEIFDILIYADGWNNGKSFGYRSISKRLLDDVCEIAFKLGYSTNQNKDSLSIATEQKYPTINKKPEIKHYKGMIYCCKVDNGLILVRRNGVATWSHNSYAISYKIQKMIEAMSGGEKPNILAIGHYHKSCFMPYRNVHSIQTGCFQAQSNWMKGKSIAAVMGGWIVEIHVDEEGTITRIKPEFIEYYKAIKDDWRNFR